MYGNDSENEIEEHVDDENVEDIFERVDHAVKDRFELWHSIYGFEGTQHAQYSQWFNRVQILARAIALTLIIIDININNVLN